MAAFLPRGTYSAAKAWVNSFGAWAANEYRPKGVTVTTLCPGFTKTEFHERMNVAPRLGLPVAGGRLPGLRVPLRLRQGQGDVDPGRQYKVITTATRMVPTRVAQRFQNIGRK